MVCDTDATVGGTFTLNVMCAAPVLYCKDVLKRKQTTRSVGASRRRGGVGTHHTAQTAAVGIKPRLCPSP